MQRNRQASSGPQSGGFQTQSSGFQQSGGFQSQPQGGNPWGGPPQQSGGFQSNSGGFSGPQQSGGWGQQAGGYGQQQGPGQQASNPFGAGAPGTSGFNTTQGSFQATSNGFQQTQSQSRPGFGQQPTFTTQPSAFGQQSGGFGGASRPGTTGAFGQTNAFTAGANSYSGGATSQPFGSRPPQQNFFAGASSAMGAFGGAPNAFGGASSVSRPGFGNVPSQYNPQMGTGAMQAGFGQQYGGLRPQTAPTYGMPIPNIPGLPFKDHLGLSYLFPNGVPDDVRNYETRRTASVAEIYKQMVADRPRTPTPPRDRDPAIWDASPRPPAPFAFSTNRDSGSSYRQYEEAKKITPLPRLVPYARPAINQLTAEFKPVSVESSNVQRALRFPTSSAGALLTPIIRSKHPDELQLTVQLQDREGSEFDLSIHKLDSVRALREKIRSEAKVSEFELENNGKILTDDTSNINDSINTGYAIRVIPTDSPSQVTSSTSKKCPLAPKLTKPGYETYPPMEELQYMTEEQLQQVESFYIRNEFGKATFDGKTDVTGLNLDQLVDIQYGGIDVYPTGVKPPPLGQKLNKPAFLEFYNLSPPHGMDKTTFAEKLKNNCHKMRAEFIHYLNDINEWKIHVPGF